MVVAVMMAAVMATVSGHQPLCLLLSEDEHEIFNVFNDLSVCCAHESET